MNNNEVDKKVDKLLDTRDEQTCIKIVLREKVLNVLRSLSIIELKERWHRLCKDNEKLEKELADKGITITTITDKEYDNRWRP